MADKVNFAGYTRPARLPSGKVSAARLRRAAAANRQPRAESRYQIWNGIDINSAYQDDFAALYVYGSADGTLPLILMGVDSSVVPYFYLHEGGGGASVFGVSASGCQCDRAFYFNTAVADPSLKDYDARFDGQHTTHVLFVDASKDSVAIGTGTCQTGFRLTVSGSQYLSGQVTASNFESTLATEAGAPFACNSTAVCTNLNADLLDGYHSSSFLMAKGATTQIPYMNPAGTDFLYSGNLTFNQNVLEAANYHTTYALGSEQITNGGFTSGTTGWTLGGTNVWFYCYAFTVSGISTTPGTGSTWTNNGQTFTVRYTNITGTAPSKAGYLMCSGTGPPSASGTLTKTSGTGDATVAFSAYSQFQVMHGATGEDTLSQDSGNMVRAPVVGTMYLLSFVISQYKTGTVTPAVGGVTLPAVSANGTYTWLFTATSTNGPVFTPSSTARFIIDSISLKEAEGGYLGDGALCLTGTLESGFTPAYGAGTRMMWLPHKGAFRVGTVSGSEWDDSNIGNNSFAAGWNCTASGNRAMVLGANCTGSGANCVVLGDASIVTFDNSIAIGLACRVYNYSGTAIGNGCEVYAYGGTAIGNCVVYGQYGVAVGGNSIWEGGLGATAVGNSCTIGVEGDAGYGASSTVVGYYSTVTGNYATGVGYTVLVDGDYAFAIGSNNSSSGSYSGTIGDNLTAGGTRTLCFGSGYSDSTANSFNWGITTRAFQLLVSEAKFGQNGDADYTMTFLGATHDGEFKWLEDEDYFEFSDGILLSSAEEIFFRDSAIHIKSADDGHLDLTADASIDLNGLALTQNVQPMADDTYYLGKNDDDNPAAYKGLILKDTTNGRYYRIEMVGGALTATDLTD